MTITVTDLLDQADDLIVQDMQDLLDRLIF